jgi:hypothetical protein
MRYEYQIQLSWYGPESHGSKSLRSRTAFRTMWTSSPSISTERHVGEFHLLVEKRHDDPAAAPFVSDSGGCESLPLNKYSGTPETPVQLSSFAARPRPRTRLWPLFDRGRGPPSSPGPSPKREPPVCALCASCFLDIRNHPVTLSQPMLSVSS